MWPRNSEFFFALWLAFSWMIFGYPEPLFITHDLICFVLISCFSLGSYLTKLRCLYLMNFLMGIWLIIFALMPFVSENPRQNYIVIGLLLLMFAIIPSPAEQAPYDWRVFMENRKRKK